MQFEILGPLCVQGPHGDVPINAPRERVLLAELLVHAQRPLTVDHLAAQVWGDREVRHPSHAVHALVSRLRGRLSAGGVCARGGCAGEPAIATRMQCYVMDGCPETLDALRFSRLVTRARRVAAGEHGEAGDPVGAVSTYTDALQLWRGPVLAGVPEGSHCLDAERQRLDELRVAALEERAELQLSLGQHAEVVSELAPVVTAYPVRERLHELLMLALSGSGRVGEALQAYRRASDLLVEHVGVGPGRRLRALHAQLLDPEADTEAHRSESLLAQLQQRTAAMELRIRQLEDALRGDATCGCGRGV